MSEQGATKPQDNGGSDPDGDSKGTALQGLSRRDIGKAAAAVMLGGGLPWVTEPALARAAGTASKQSSSTQRGGARRRPNFLLIVADDMGFSDLGCYGSEIRTPNLDALASSGLRLSNFHVAPACSPTRVMLMTGVDHHKAGIGSMNEVVYPGFKGAPGYEGYINDRVVALPELLRDAGYRTMMAGKWHLGDIAKALPAARGFERSFCLLPAGSDHWASGVFHKMAPNRPLYADGPDYVNELPADFYSSDFYTQRLIQYLDEDEETPFFAYLPFSAPHWPVHAPAQDIARYRGMYDDGHEALRLRRLAGLKRMGIVGEDVVPHAMETDQPAWAEMSADERAFSARTMEVYAAMLDRLDQNVGRLMAHLKATDRLDDTVIIFLSDNGAEGAIAEAYPILGPVFKKAIAQYGDNRLENIGLPNSCMWYGPRWAQAATAPLRLMKSYTTEGGIRVACIMSGRDVPHSGTISDSFCTVKDIAPTILAMAGVPRAGATYDGHPVYPMEGVSWLPWLGGQVKQPHPPGTVTGWELFNRRAIRKDDWKLVYTPGPDGKAKWELYNVAKDPGEVRDLASEHPEKVKELLILWKAYVRDNGVIEDLPTIFQGEANLWKSS